MPLGRAGKADFDEEQSFYRDGQKRRCEDADDITFLSTTSKEAAPFWKHFYIFRIRKISPQKPFHRSSRKVAQNGTTGDRYQVVSWHVEKRARKRKPHCQLRGENEEKVARPKTKTKTAALAFPLDTRIPSIMEITVISQRPSPSEQTPSFRAADAGLSGPKTNSPFTPSWKKANNRFPQVAKLLSNERQSLAVLRTKHLSQRKSTFSEIFSLCAKDFHERHILTSSRHLFLSRYLRFLRPLPFTSTSSYLSISLHFPQRLHLSIKNVRHSRQSLSQNLSMGPRSSRAKVVAFHIDDALPEEEMHRQKGPALTRLFAKNLQLRTQRTTGKSPPKRATPNLLSEKPRGQLTIRGFRSEKLLTGTKEQPVLCQSLCLQRNPLSVPARHACFWVGRTAQRQRVRLVIKFANGYRRPESEFGTVSLIQYFT